MNTSLTQLHKNLLNLIENNPKVYEDIEIINTFGITVWLDLWREGLVITDKYGRAYLTNKGSEIISLISSEEHL